MELIKKTTEIREVTESKWVQEEYVEKKPIEVYTLEFTDRDLERLRTMVMSLDRRNSTNKRNRCNSDFLTYRN